MDPTQPTTTGTPTDTSCWALPFGLLTGVGVMGLVLACLEVLDPASDTALTVALVGPPAALGIVALIPARRWRLFRQGMGCGALMFLAVLLFLAFALWGGN